MRHMYSTRWALAVVSLTLVGLLTTTPAPANLVQDPGFSAAAAGSGTWGKWGAVDFYDWGGNLPDWWGASTAFYANTAGNSGGIFDWDIAGNAGVTYDLAVDFWFQQVFDAHVTLSLEYYADDNSTLLGTDSLTLTPGDVYISDGTESEEWMRWQNYSLAGAPAPAGTAYVRPGISYDSVTGNSNQWFFADNVTVTPEPATFVALALAALTLRRRD